MDLRRLHFLVRVIDMGSITRAAAALRIAQPALSQHIQVLERSLGTPLLLRVKGGVVPTQAGRIAYRNAKLMQRQIERTRAEVKMLTGAPTGRVAVGIAPHSHARQLVQPLLQAVRARFPDILLHLSENFEGVLAEDLRVRRMDMALFYEIVPRPGFRYETVLVEPLYLVGRDIGSMAALTDALPIVLPSPAHALRQLVEAVYSAARTRPSLVAEIESFETLAGAVRAGLGATILPLSVATRLAQAAGLALRPFGTAPTHVTLSLCSADEDAPSEAARVVHALVAELAAGLAEPVTPRSVAPRASVRPPDARRQGP